MREPIKVPLVNIQTKGSSPTEPDEAAILDAKARAAIGTVQAIAEASKQE